MTPVDAPDGSTFEDALAEAVASLREAYPDADVPDGQVTPESLAALLAEPTVDAEGRRDVARILGMLAEEFPAELAGVAPAVVERLDGADAEVRTHLLRTLGYVSKTDPDAVRDATESVVAMLDAEDTGVVRNATWVLSNVAASDPDSVATAFPEIAGLLEHDDEEVRRRAASALAAAPESVLEADPEVLDRLFDLLESPALYRTAGRTLVAVAPVHGSLVVDGLFECLESGRPAVREHAAWTLVPLADDYPELVRPRWPTLVEIVRDDDDHQVQNSAAAALAALAADRPDPDLVRELTGLLDHDDEFVRRYGCLALGDVAVASGNDAALRALADARDDEMAVVSREAEQRLANAAREHPEAVAEIAPEFVEQTDDDS